MSSGNFLPSTLFPMSVKRRSGDLAASAFAEFQHFAMFRSRLVVALLGDGERLLGGDRNASTNVATTAMRTMLGFLSWAVRG